jgi:hypothetical protein
MGYPVAYLSGNTTTYETGMFKRGTIGQNQAAALTGSYRWWNGIDVTSSQYLIYSDTFTTSATTAANATPAAWTTPDLSDQSLLNLINTLPERVGKLPFTYVPVALQWIQSTGRYFLMKNGYENIVTNGLAFNADAGWYLSYSGTGTTFKDLTSNGYTGTLVNGTSFNNTNGGGLVFDGVDDTVSFGDILDLGTNDMTINCWFKINPSATYVNYLVSKAFYGGQNYRYGFYVWDKKIGGFMQGNAGPDVERRTVNTISDNTWYMGTIVFNRASSYKIYVNGVEQTLDGDSTISQWNGLNFQSNNPFRIGSYNYSDNSSPNFIFNGTIANTQLYFRALNLTEITQNFNAQKTRFGLTADTIVTSGLTLNLDAGSVISYPTTGTSWYDLSYVNNNATLNNGPTFVSSGVSSSVLFDGFDDYALGSILVTPSFSVNFWIKPLLVRNYNPSFVINNWGDFIWHTTSNGSIYCGTDVGSRFNPSSTGCGAGAVALNTIQNFTYTFNGGIGSLYKNGTLLVSANNHGTPVSSGTIKSYGISEASNSGNFNWYNFQIYNRALSASEVLQNYNALKGRYGL